MDKDQYIIREVKLQLKDYIKGIKGIEDLNDYGKGWLECSEIFLNQIKELEKR